MAIVPSDIESESGDSGTSACFSDGDLIDTDTDVDTVPSSPEAVKSNPTPMSEPKVTVEHPALKTWFIGVRHNASEPGAEVDQFRGIKYASVAMRFRRSLLNDTFPEKTDATENGYVLFTDHRCSHLSY